MFFIFLLFQLKVFSQDGKPKVLIAADAQVRFKSPSAVVVFEETDKQGTQTELLAVKDDQRIQVFKAREGEFVRTIGENLLRRPYGTRTR